jgi:small subunit ribosomal protein S8
MTMTDPIADLIIRIRNAGMAKHRTVEVPYSKIKAEITKILKENGMIADYRVLTDTFPLKIRILLKYNRDEEHIIKGMKRISKPGLRIYTGREDVPVIRSGMGFAILSTSHGIMTDHDCRKVGIGGEVLAYIW